MSGLLAEGGPVTLSLQVQSWWRPGWKSVLPSVLPAERPLLGREGTSFLLPTVGPVLFSPV